MTSKLHIGGALCQKIVNEDGTTDSGCSVLFALSTGTRIVLPHTTTGNVGHCGMLS
eukprot:COSAG05_NODE_16924_length_335_cov_4.525424_1_plen_55_part_10